jgi:hypothetical protein
VCQFDHEAESLERVSKERVCHSHKDITGNIIMAGEERAESRFGNCRSTRMLALHLMFVNNGVWIYM